MAESEANWWGSWYQAAKDKSTEVLEFVKRDLDEFSCAVKSEATNVVSSTATVLKDKLKLDDSGSTANNMKKSLSSFLGQVTNVLNPLPEDEDTETLVIQDSNPVILNRLQAQLYTLVMDTNTYLTDPVEQMREYEAWLEFVGGDVEPEELSAQLEANPDLNAQYAKLVPVQVSHVLFWHRYLFRKAVLEDEEARRQAVQRRVERAHVTEDFQWDEDEDFGGDLDIPEEEQVRLLSEYEKECEAAQKRKSLGSGDGNGNQDITQTADKISELQLNTVKSNTLSSDGSGKNTDNLTPEEGGVVQESESNTSRSDKEIPVSVNQFLSSDDRNEDSLHAEFENEHRIKTKDKNDMVIVGDTMSCQTSSSGDKESNDDDWEKEFDLDEPESDIVEQTKEENEEIIG